MLTDPRGRILVNMPLIMGRRVLVKNEQGEMVPDHTWHENMKALYASLIDFLRQQSLIDPTVQVGEDVASVVLREGDLTDCGRALWKTGVIGKWLGSFDRNPRKDVRDYKQLERAIKNL